MWGKVFERLESRHIECVHQPNVSNASIFAEQKALRESLRCLCSSVLDRLFAGINQSTNDQRN